MNILHLEYAGNIGGIEKLCKDIGMNSKEDKHFFIFVHEGGVIYEQMKENHLDVSCLYFENKDIVKLYKFIKKFTYENKIDDIIVHHPSPLIWLSVFLYLNFSHNSNVVIYVHNVYNEIVKHSIFRKKIYDYLLRKSDGIIAISEFVKNTILEQVDISELKVNVIYNGVKCPDYTEWTFRKYNNPLKIIYIGRLIEKKGVQVLLNSVSYLKNKENYEIQIIGDGPYKDELENITKELQITDYVTFYGNQINVGDWLCKADIFVHPAIWQEGFGIAIVEALSYGKICVASNRGAIPEIITNGDNGILFESENAISLADKIMYASNMMSDIQIINMQKKAILSSQKFSIEKMAKNLHEYLLYLEEQ